MQQWEHTYTKKLFVVYLNFKFNWAFYTYGNPLQYSCLLNPMDGGAW